VRLGVRGQRSFLVHSAFALAVIACAAAFRVSLGEWCLLALCTAVVLAAEMFNSALEFLAKAITKEHDYHLGTALDIGSGAVLIASIGATIVGLIIFLNRLGLSLGWWAAARL
jgi:diacylglycerol kinase